MVMDGYPQDLPGAINVLNRYILESINNRNFRKITGKGQTEGVFTKTQEKDVNDKKNNNRRVKYHCLDCGKKYHCVVECPNL